MCRRMMERLAESCREVKNVLVRTDICWKTYALVSCFALSSWITVNGIWSELPVIVQYAPEKWKLPSFIVVIIQLGIVGPLLFSFANRFCPRVFTEKLTIYILMCIGTVSCLFLSLFWKKTTYVAGEWRSVALLLLVFTLAFVDCTSTVVFLTFMSLYDPRYLTALYIGESFCGLLPGVTAIIQGSPRTICNSNSSVTITNTTEVIHQSDGLLFNTSIYFIVLLGMMVLCTIAFLSLNHLPFAKREQRSAMFFRTEVNTDEPTTPDNQCLVFEQPNMACTSVLARKDFVMFGMQGIACSFTFGIIPSLAPYAFEPFGNVTYHLVSSLGPIGTAIMCFFIIWSQRKSFQSVLVAFLVFICLAIYLVLLAWKSPTPWLYNYHVGRVIAVVLGILVSMVGTYMRLTIAIIMREKSKQALYWCGMSVQIGSLIGALGIFPFVNILHEFHQKKQC